MPGSSRSESRGKLPAKSMRVKVHALEYGTDALEIHADSVETGQRVLIVDDVLATGGTAAAAARLVRQLGGELHGLAFLIELVFLSGKAKLSGEQVYSVLQDQRGPASDQNGWRRGGEKP